MRSRISWLLMRHIIRFIERPLLETIAADALRWPIQNNGSVGGLKKKILRRYMRYPEFQSLFYYRIRKADSLGYVKFIANIMRKMQPGTANLIISVHSIGKGLRIQHGFSTIVLANTIGENCWINQQVTVGARKEGDRPSIGNNVRICAGAKLIGDITIGNNVTIGANAVVVKNVPSNCTVAGVPARIIRRDGSRVDENL